MEAADNGQPRAPTVQRDVVVIGASAGGVDALQALVAGLPLEFPAPILVVLHVPATGTSVLPQILSRRGELAADFAHDGEEPRRGQIYVAPADHHILFHEGRIRLSRGPRENGHRPAIDPLFRSAGRSVGPRAVGVIMSGLLDDGAAGLRFITEHGGAALVQDPDDAAFPSMPRAALEATEVDAVARAADMAQELCRIVDVPLPERVAARASPEPAPLDRTIDGLDRVELDPVASRELLEGPPTALTCPECGGALWEQDDGARARFACHVGHSYTLQTLEEEQGRSLETTLWSAVRALEERADVDRRLARRTHGARADVYRERSKQAQEHARKLRDVLSTSGARTAAARESS